MRSSKSKWLIMLFSAVALMLSGCRPAENVGSMEWIKARKELIVQTCANFPPFEYKDAEGRIVGVDVEIANRIASRLGVILVVVDSPLGKVVPAVSNQEAALGISAISITEERKRHICFSDSYLETIQHLILPKDSSVTHLEDLKDKTICAEYGSTGMALVERVLRKGSLAGSNTCLRPYQLLRQVISPLQAGEVAAVVADKAVAESVVAKVPELKSIPMVSRDGEPLTEQYGIVVAKENRELLNVVNEVIQEMKQDGSLAKLVEKHSRIME